MTIEEQTVIELYNDRQTLLNISVYIGISVEKVHKILAEHKVPIRKAGGNRDVKPIIAPVYKNKYDYLLYEEVNQGKDYKEYFK